MLNIEKNESSGHIEFKSNNITCSIKLNVAETFIETAIFYSGSMFLELKGS